MSMYLYRFSNDLLLGSPGRGPFNSIPHGDPLEAFIGPLSVLPLFTIAMVLGSLVYSHRHRPCPLP